jgi:hypothetical protein
MTFLDGDSSHWAPRVAYYAIIACWWAFALTFWLRKRPPRVRETKRDWTSLIGLLLQGLSYGVVWYGQFRPPRLGPAISPGPQVGWGRAVIAVTIALASVWLVNVAARRLGAQWALTARLVEGHTLIQDGPYRFVRNPIYTGMLGLLLATGMVMSRWAPLLGALLLFMVGTYIRINREERLLRPAFGDKFEAYASRVSALIPGIY